MRVPLDEPPASDTDLTSAVSPELVGAAPALSAARSRHCWGWLGNYLLQAVWQEFRRLLALLIGLGGLFVLLAAITTLSDPSVRSSGVDVPVACVALVLGSG
jgi:hypothetical protein